MKNLKILLIVILSLSVWSCEKDDIYDLVDNIEVIDGIDEVTEEPNQDTTEDTTEDGSNDSTEDTSDSINQVYENGILVTKNSVFLDFSEGTEKTFYSTNSRFHFNNNGDEYFLYASDGWESYLFKRINSEWTIIDVEYNTNIKGNRNYRIVNDNTFVFAGSGEQHWTPHTQWGDYAWIGEINNEKIEYRKVSNVFDYYHGIAAGDLTNDGLFDVVTNSGWVFIQNTDGSFDSHNISPMEGSHYQNYRPYQTDEFQLVNKQRISELKNFLEPEIYDLYNGGRPEIILSFIDVSNNVSDEEQNVPRGDVLIYEFEESSNQYIVRHEIPRRNTSGMVGSMQISDINNDGLNDLVFEVIPNHGGDDSTQKRFEVWIQNTDKTFYKKSEFSFTPGSLDTSQFSMMDVNNDGYDDVIFRPFSGGEDFIQNWCTSECGQREQQGLPVKDGVKLHNLIYLNDGYGNFNKFQNELIIKDTFVEWLKPFMRDGKLCFFGSVYKYIDGVTMEIELVDIELQNVF